MTRLGSLLDLPSSERKMKDTTIVQRIEAILCTVQPSEPDLAIPEVKDVLSKLKKKHSALHNEYVSQWKKNLDEVKAIDLPDALASDELSIPPHPVRVKAISQLYHSFCETHKETQVGTEGQIAGLAVAVEFAIFQRQPSMGEIYKAKMDAVDPEVRKRILSGEIQPAQVPHIGHDTDSRAQIIDESTSFMASVAEVFDKALDAYDQASSSDSALWKAVWSTMQPLRKACDLQHSCCVGILGERGVGKSTLVNTILGADVVPTNEKDTSTASVTELSSWDRDEYSMSIEFLPRTEFASIFREAHTTLNAYDGDLDDLEDDDPDIDKIKDIIKIHDGQKRAMSMEQLKERLDELSQVPEPNQFILERFRDQLSKRFLPVHLTKDPAELKEELSKFADKREINWPIVDRIKIQGPFHRKGLLGLGMTILDIPGVGDGNVSLTARIRDAILSCSQRLLVLKPEMVGTKNSRAYLKHYFNGPDQFTLLVNKVEMYDDFRQELEGAFDDVAARKVEEVRESLKGECSGILDVDALQIYLTELNPIFNKQSHLDQLKEMVAATMQPTRKDSDSLATGLRRTLDETKNQIKELASGNLRSGISSDELIKETATVFKAYFTELEARIDAYFVHNPSADFPLDDYKQKISATSFIALFRGAGRLIPKFSLDLEDAICPQRTPDFPEIMFDLSDSLMKTLRESWLTVVGRDDLKDRLDTILWAAEHDAEITMNFGQLEVQRALLKEFFNWSTDNKVTGTGARNKLAKKLSKWLRDESPRLSELAKNTFRAAAKARMEAAQKNICDFLEGLNANYSSCDHGNRGPSHACQCGQLEALKALFPVAGSLPSPPIELKPSVSRPADAHSWRNLHEKYPLLVPATTSLESYASRSMRKTPGFIVIVPKHGEFNLFKLTTAANQDGNNTIPVSIRPKAVLVTLQQMLSKTKDTKSPKYYNIGFEDLREIVRIVATTLDEDLLPLTMII